MEKLLFEDSETFVEQRPKELPEKIKDKIWQDIANKIIKNGWSDNEPDEIISDLKDLDRSDSGYEMAKHLDYSCGYSIETSFIEFLDYLYKPFREAKREMIRTWVKAHNIKPKHELGTRLIVDKSLDRKGKLSVGQIIFVNRIEAEEGRYCVSIIKGSNANSLFDYEEIEASCSVV